MSIGRFDNLTNAQRAACMAAIKGVNTQPEIRTCRIVRSLGYHYGTHRKDLPGKPDIVFARRQQVIFVHGCFWHMHNCKRGKSTPKTNARFWRFKREATKRRDRRASAALRRDGWKLLTVWECQARDEVKLVRRISKFLEEGANKRDNL